MKRENKRIRIHFTTFFTPEQMMAASKLLCAIAVGLQLMPYVFSIDTEASEYTVFVTLINLLLFIIPLLIFAETMFTRAFLQRIYERRDKKEYEGRKPIEHRKSLDLLGTAATEEYQSSIRNIGDAICSTVMPIMISFMKKGIDSKIATFLAVSFLFSSLLQFMKIKKENLIYFVPFIFIIEGIYLVYIIILCHFLF